MKIKDMAQTVILICCLVVIPVFSFSFILYSKADLKYYEILDKSFTATFGFFGGAATLAAAYIASRLFNDWKEQHNKQVLAHEAKDTFQLFHNQRDCIHKLKYTCEDIINEKRGVMHSWTSIAKEYDLSFLTLYNTDKDKMSSFCFLSEGQLVYDLTMDYYKETASLSSYLAEKRNMPFSETTFLNKESSQELFNLLKNLEDKNAKVLNKLKTYIFVKK